MPEIINSVSPFDLEMLDANVHLDVCNCEHKTCCTVQIYQIIVQRLTGRYLLPLLGEMKSFPVVKLYYVSHPVDELDIVNRF